jgi:hypothetical protein
VHLPPCCSPTTSSDCVDVCLAASMNCSGQSVMMIPERSRSAQEHTCQPLCHDSAMRVDNNTAARCVQCAPDMHQQGQVLLAQLAQFWLTRSQLASRHLMLPLPHWWPLLHVLFCAAVIAARVCHVARASAFLPADTECAGRAVANMQWALLLNIVPLGLAVYALAACQAVPAVKHGWSWLGVLNKSGHANSLSPGSIMGEVQASCSDCTRTMMAAHHWCAFERKQHSNISIHTVW